MEVAESSVPAGRIDRKIEFPLPDEKTKKRIFQIHTSRMTLADDVTLDDLIMAKDDLSGADIKVSTWVGLPLGIGLVGRTANSRGGCLAFTITAICGFNTASKWKMCFLLEAI